MKLEGRHGKLATLLIVLGNCLISCTLHSHLSGKITDINALVTFIIPTTGRPTLKNAISSLQKQNNKNWRALVIFDGLNPGPLPKDSRIQVMRISKTGCLNHAGEVRNLGMKHVQTEWIAFLDDDDSVSIDYLDRLIEEINLNNKLDVVIFRMYHPSKARLIPSPYDKNFSIANVGISFSMKTALYRAGCHFNPSGTEDFNLLDHMREKGYKMVISPYITYWVRGFPNRSISNTYICERAYIN